VRAHGDEAITIDLRNGAYPHLILRPGNLAARTAVGASAYAWRAGQAGDGLVTAPALPAAATTSFLAAECVRCVAAASAAKGASAVGSVAFTASQ
jgi:hypothetical protein